MKERTKNILIALSPLIVIAGIFLCMFIVAFYKFGVEERIAGTYSPVAFALDRFVEKNGIPPTNLAQLVPEYLSCVPPSRRSCTIDYKLVEGTNWILNIHSKSLIVGNRIYSWRSTWEFTESERAKKLGQYHGITVFKE